MWRDSICAFEPGMYIIPPLFFKSYKMGNCIMITIKHRFSNKVLHEGQGTLQDTLQMAIAAGVNFSGADLYGTNLRDANLYGINLKRADLRGVDLCAAHLRCANLDNANLRGANFSNADLRETYLCGADLHGANLSGANISTANLGGANLCGANLHGAYLRGSNLCRANLSRSDISAANLGGTNLSESNLSEANLSGADLIWANLRATNLSGSKNIICLSINDPRGYRPVAVWVGNQWIIYSGCRKFTVIEARQHWGSIYRGDRNTGDQYINAIDWLELQSVPVAETSSDL